MVTISQLDKFVLGEAGAKQLGAEEGRIIGLTDGKIKKAVVCWMATVEAIEFAAKKNADTIICHESLFLPYNAPLGAFGEPPRDFLSWSANHRKSVLLFRHNIGVYRLHGIMDTTNIMDVFVDQLDLGEVVYQDPEKYHRVVKFKPVALKKIARQIKGRLGLKSVLIVGDGERKVSRAGFIWGGMGLFVNARFIEELIALGCDLLIGGESDEYAMQYIKDSGTCAVITSHLLSEREGVRKFSELLAEKFKGSLEVLYFANGLPYSPG
ncbi:MAG: Nif3-like dinuclear metal center hexameric protein [Candidatus Omnitrophica bacterium]|nr:Nif3-like dinuclear metal center hexameric protein [Candidatus Omnitrophota bacterium]